jgi:hypothetical protein
MTTTYDANIPYDSVIGYDGNPPTVTSAQLPTWQLEVFNPFTSVVSPLPEAVIDTMDFAESQAAAISFTIANSSKGANLLGDLMIVRLKENSKYVRDGAWLLRGQNWNAGKRAQIKTWTGRSLLWDRLNYTVIQPTPRKLFTGRTPGYILNDLFTEAQTRDVGFWDNFTWTFTATLDSNGHAWPTPLGSMEYLPTANYADIVSNLVDKGVVQVSLVGNEIRAVVPDTDGAQTPVLLVVGKDVTDAPQQSSADNLASDVVIVGDEGVTVVRANTETRARYWREEVGISQGGTKDIGTLSVFGDVALSGGSEPRIQRTYELVVTQERPFLPVRDYVVGDWVRAQHADDTPAQAYRVKQITLKQAGGKWTGSLVLNDKFTENELRLVKKVQGIIGGAVITGSAQTSTPDADKDLSIPNAPTTPVVNMTSYVDDTGHTKVAATVEFSPPVTNTDGSPFTDPGDYRMGWRYSTESTSAWRYLRNDSPLWYLSPLDPGRSVVVLAQAIDSSGHISAYSPGYSFDTVVDTTPPPVPSTPLLTSLLRTLVVQYNGLTAAGAQPPADQNRIEVFTSLVNDFNVELEGTLRGYLNSAGQLSLPMYTVPIGQTVYVKFVAVDNNGNRSAPSIQNSNVLQGVTGSDIVAGSIVANNLAVGSVTAQAILAGAITADKISLGQTMNLVQDPSFDNPDWCARRLTTAWTEKPSRWGFKKSGDINWSLIKRNGGYLQALSSADGVNGGRMYLTDWIYTQLGESYYFGMYMREGEFTPNAGSSIRMGIDVAQADGAILTDGIPCAPLGAFWTKYEYRYVVGNPAWTKVRFWIRADNLTSGDIAIDDVEVRGGVGRTEYAGSRGVIDPLGIFAWDGDEIQTVAVDFRTGDVTVAGTITSGFSGKRTVINPGTTLLPEMRFYPQSGDLYAYVNASDNGSYPFIGVNAPDVGTSSQVMILYDNSFVLGEVNKTLGEMVGAGVQGQGTGAAAYLWLFGKVPLASDGDMTLSSYLTKNIAASGGAFGIAVSKPPAATSGQWLLLYSIRRNNGQRFHHFVTATAAGSETISFYPAVSGGVDNPAFNGTVLDIRYMWVRSDGDA